MAAEYRDPRPLAQAAILWTWIWLGVQALWGAASAYMLAFLATQPPDTPGTIVVVADGWEAALLLVPIFSPYLVSGFLILRWIYRTNANAQAYSTGMKVSPGWNVGFFFVPVANLWKPFQGIRQSWEVTNMHDQSLPAWVRWWWGCWLGANFISTLSFAMGGSAENAGAVSVCNLLGAIVSVPLALLLIRLIRTLSAAQERMHREECFV